MARTIPCMTCITYKSPSWPHPLLRCVCRVLAGYIFGGNSKRDAPQSAEKIAMTSPVAMTMTGKSEKIAMTSPVAITPSSEVGGQTFLTIQLAPCSSSTNIIGRGGSSIQTDRQADRHKCPTPCSRIAAHGIPVPSHLSQAFHTYKSELYPLLHAHYITLLHAQWLPATCITPGRNTHNTCPTVCTASGRQHQQRQWSWGAAHGLHHACLQVQVCC